MKPWSGIQNLLPNVPVFTGETTPGTSDMSARTNTNHPQVPSSSTGPSDRDVDTFARSLLQQIQHRNEVQIFVLFSIMKSFNTGLMTRAHVTDTAVWAPVIKKIRL